jgi:cephalosporin hydroxylase
MKVQVDTNARELTIQDGGGVRRINLFSRESFEILSKLWLKVGWNEKYSYAFSWFGRPIIQLPEDIVRSQELIYELQPDVLVETGVAHGGSLVFYASLFEAMGKGAVVGVDIEIRRENRKAIEDHPLAARITLIEGDSVSESVLARVQSAIGDAQTVLVFLDSDHSRRHVLDELRAYSPLVSVGSYIVATDGIMRDLHDVPRGQQGWREDNPCAAVEQFLRENSKFELHEPRWPFNESPLRERVTHWPAAYLKRVT